MSAMTERQLRKIIREVLSDSAVTPKQTEIDAMHRMNSIERGPLALKLQADYEDPTYDDVAPVAAVIDVELEEAKRSGMNLNSFMKESHYDYDYDSYEPPVSAEDVLDDEELKDYRRSQAVKRVSRMRPDPHDQDWFENAVERELTGRN